MPDFHKMSVREVCTHFSVDPEKGLSKAQVEERKGIYGKNIIVEERKVSLLPLFISQFKSPLLLLLIFAAFLSYLLGEIKEAFAISVAVFLSAVFSTYLEWKADESVKELKKFLKERVKVLREGEVIIIPSEEVVPGDVLILEEGDIVPADARVIEAHNLALDESIITGESVLVDKTIDRVEGDEIHERKNMVFAGTKVGQGQGKAVVVGIGKQTFIGRLSKKLEWVQKAATPLERRVEDLSKNILTIFSISIGILFLLSLFQERPLDEVVLYMIVLAVAVIPEGLATIMTMILALGVKEMAKHNAIVKNVSAVDSLGSVDFIATDKTGTLTEGILKVVEVATFNSTKEEVLLNSIIASFIITSEKEVSNDVDRAIYSYVKENHPELIEKAFERFRNSVVRVIPFDSKRRVFEVALKDGVVIKGAGDEVLKIAKKTEKKEVIKSYSEFLRREEAEGKKVIGVFSNGRLLGALVLQDNLRPEAKETIMKCKEGGIRVIIITGDSKRAATFIAQELGLITSPVEVVEWKEISHMRDEEIYSTLKRVSVIARAPPESKLRIVEILEGHGHIVAVTGDGVNDVLALKKAHVGVAMGERGTDVAKEVADIVLVDDNLKTLVEAIEYGRNIFYNIANFIRFQLTTSVSAFITSALSFLYLLPFPINAIQLLFINIIMDGPPALANAFEKPKRDLLKIGPIKKWSFLEPPRNYVILFNSVLISFLTFTVFVYYLKESLEIARTMAFNTFALLNLFNALNARSLSEPFWRGLSRNKFLLVSVFAMLIFILLINSDPFLMDFFSLSKIYMKDWLLILSIILIYEISEEIRKRMGIWIA